MSDEGGARLFPSLVVGHPMLRTSTTMANEGESGGENDLASEGGENEGSTARGDTEHRRRRLEYCWARDQSAGRQRREKRAAGKVA